jgi:hypothetical protein
MKTSRGKCEPEGAANFARALESATTLWDEGNTRAATEVLRQAAYAADRAGDVTRAQKLEQLLRTLESALQFSGVDPLLAYEGEPESQPETMPSGVARQEAEVGTSVRLRTPPYSTQSMSRAPATAKDTAGAPTSDRGRRSTMPAEADIDRQPASDPIRFTHSAPVPYPRPGWFEREDAEAAIEFEPRRTRPARRPTQRKNPRHRRRKFSRTRVPSPVTPVVEQEVSVAPASSVRDPGVRVAVRSAFTKLPQPARAVLRRTAVRVNLPQGATAPDFGIAFLSRGSLCAHPEQLDRCAVAVHAGSLVHGRFGRGSRVGKRWVACGGPATLTLWDEVAAAKLLSMAPGLGELLRSATPRIDALVCATQGPLGEKFSRRVRASLLSGAALRVLVPNEVLVAKGCALPGLIITGAGCLLQIDGPKISELPPGGVPCLAAVLARSPAPATLRAGGVGASVLLTNLRTAHELFCTMPALLDLLSRD